MSDNFVEVILPAVEAMGTSPELRIETDDISTLVVGTPSNVFAAVERAYGAACRAGGHVVLSALFSRGCPGEPDDPLCTPQGPESATAEPVARAPGSAERQRAGIAIDAQFSIYPLGIENYMNSIAAGIDSVKQAGVFDRSKHFCTRLHGDIRDVFAAVEKTFSTAARETGHVVIHLTASKGSPSAKKASSHATHETTTHDQEKNHV